MARLKPTIGWAISGRAGAHDVALDSRLPALVAAAARRGTLAAAARDLGLSYRAAWGLVEEAARLVGEPLLVLSRGKGAALAPQPHAFPKTHYRFRFTRRRIAAGERRRSRSPQATTSRSRSFATAGGS